LSIVKESSVVNVVITEAKGLGVSDIIVAICFGKGLAILEWLEEISNWCGWIPLSLHQRPNVGEVLGYDGAGYGPEMVEEFVMGSLRSER
jgi:hypothetical protein